MGGHVAQGASPVHDEGRPGRRANFPGKEKTASLIKGEGLSQVSVMIDYLATPQLAEKERSLSLRIGKPGAPPNPPSDTLFLLELI